MPRRLLVRTADRPLYRFLVLHLLTSLAIALAFALAATLLESPYVSPELNLWQRWLMICSDALEELLQLPWWGLVLLLSIAGWELALLVVAWVLTPWGARDEPWWGSFRHGLRAVWLTLPVTVPLMLAPAAYYHAAERSHAAIQAAPAIAWPTPPKQPALPPAHPDAVQAWMIYNQALVQHSDEIDKLLQQLTRRIPWIYRHHEGATILMYFCAALCFVGMLLRSASAPRRIKASPQTRPPMCESCGYNLSTLAMDGRCPECGQEVRDSLGEDVRCGSPWEHRRTTGRLRSWWQCARGAIRCPARLGRTLPVSRPATAHRSFLFVHLALIIPIAAIASVRWILTVTTNPPPAEFRVNICMAGLGFGVLCTIAAIAATLATAHVVGGLMGRSSGRNLLPASMQMASYLAAYVVVWALLGAVWTFCILKAVEAHVFRAPGRALGFGEDALGLIVWALPNIAALGVYLFLLARGTQAARYANR